MEKFVPYEKLSKKKKRELDLKRRVTWEMNPVTRRPANPKAYTRKKRVRDDYDDPGRVFYVRDAREGAFFHIPRLRFRRDGGILEAV